MPPFREQRLIRQGLGLLLLSLIVLPIAAVYASDLVQGTADVVAVSDSLSTSLVPATHTNVGEDIKIVDSVGPDLVAAIRQSLTDPVTVSDQFSNGLVPAIRESLSESVGVLDVAASSIRAAIRIGLTEVISLPDAIALELQTISTTITNTISSTTSTISSVPEFGLAAPVLAALLFVAFAFLVRRKQDPIR